MIDTKFFRNAKSYAAQKGLVLPGAIVLMAALATGLLAQTNTPPAGAFNAQPSVGAPSNAIIGSPMTGFPASAPARAIVGTPLTGFPAGRPARAIVGTPLTGFPAGAPARAIVGTPLTGFPAGTPARAIVGAPMTGFSAGAPVRAIVGTPMTGFSAGAPARAIVGTAMTGLPAGVPLRVRLWEHHSPIFLQYPRLEGITRSSVASLTKPANSKAVLVKPITTNNPRRTLLSRANHPAPRTIHPVPRTLKLVPSTNNDALTDGNHL